MAESDRHRFSGLELLPTPMLEKIIEQDFNQEADYDPELIDYVLALMVQRAKNENPHSIPDIQSSWNKLQQRLDGEVDLGPLPTAPIPDEKIRKSSRVRLFLRYVAVVAACVAIIFGAMITVQAMGVDVFGVLAEWTESTFQFLIEDNTHTETSPPTNGDLCESLARMDIPTGLAPTHIPSYFEFVDVTSFATERYIGVHASYSKPDSNKQLIVEITEHLDSSDLANIVYEKSPGQPAFLSKSGMQFYLFENSKTWIATWSDARYCVTISVPDSKETTTAIIDSIIGGIP